MTLASAVAVFFFPGDTLFVTKRSPGYWRDYITAVSRSGMCHYHSMCASERGGREIDRKGKTMLKDNRVAVGSFCLACVPGLSGQRRLSLNLHLHIYL